MDTTLLLTTGFISLSYVAVASVITPANARYLLEGDNTMSEEQQAFNIDRYLTVFLTFFRKLSRFPPLSLLPLTAFLGSDEAIIISSIVQSVPFLWFVWRSYVFQR